MERRKRIKRKRKGEIKRKKRKIAGRNEIKIKIMESKITRIVKGTIAWVKIEKQVKIYLWRTVERHWKIKSLYKTAWLKFEKRNEEKSVKYIGYRRS